MRALDYAFRQAWTSLTRGGAGSVFAVVAIALALIVLGSLLLLTWNADRLLAQWSAAAELSVYLRDEATSEQRGAIEAALDGSGVVVAREFVSKAQALTRFRREFAELAAVADGFDDNPFPAAVEVRLQPHAERDGRLDALIREVASLPGVADVRYDREWLTALSAAVGAIRAAGLTFALLMALAAAITVATVVRLGLYARRDEIEIMELVGAPLTYIRGPFVAEGVLQGGMGAVLAIAALWAVFRVGSSVWSAELTAGLGAVPLAFLPLHLCLWLVAGGMAVGAMGGLLAARHAA
jgi:cell division transport system permease protein